MNKVFEKISERLEELRETYDEIAFIEMNTNGHTLDFEYAKGKKDVMLDVKEIVQEVAEEFATDTNVGSKGNYVLEFANLLKELCCKKDEDYDNPVISPKYLNDIIENLLLDYNEQNNNGWIPCSEQLPEVNVRVLTTHENGIVQVAFLTENGNFVIKDSDGERYIIPVVAWQPLPEPYKESD